MHINYTHPPVYLKSSPGSLPNLTQCKCRVRSRSAILCRDKGQEKVCACSVQTQPDNYWAVALTPGTGQQQTTVSTPQYLHLRMQTSQVPGRLSCASSCIEEERELQVSLNREPKMEADIQRQANRLQFELIHSVVDYLLST